MITTYYRIPTEVLTDEQARLVSEISGRLPTKDSMRFLAGVSDRIRHRSGIGEEELYELITDEMTRLGFRDHVRTH